ncbi:ABC transporter permease [Acetobacterium bakii]|uniref:ABC transporter permease n=1 Tax=Acetobacterium bakii TaxID=52689 RepID=UPI000E0F2C79|nr:ABC transporter permease [Acetobacterium bakii]
MALLNCFQWDWGLCSAVFLKTEAMANQILSIVINLFAILGGLLFPIDGYGKIARTISYLSPAKWLVKATFAMIYDNNFRWFYYAVIGLILATAAVFIVCDKTFRKEDCIC